MTKLEKLENLISQSKIDLINYHFKSDRIRAMCSNNLIALSDKVELENEKLCVLLEEYLHIILNAGDITQNLKEENKARGLAYSFLINTANIVKAYKYGCRTVYEIAEFLDVTEEFLMQGLEYYKEKYGTCLKLKEYIIYFVPNLQIKEVL